MSQVPALRSFFGAFALFSIAFTGDARAEALLPSIISFAGTGAVTVRTPSGQREAKVGMELDYGSRIRTGAANSVTIGYPDGSLLAVDSSTEVEIQEKTRGTQANTLHEGQVRGDIKPLAATAGDAGAKVPRRKFKFLIRSRAAVMGVRGTQFVMGLDPSGLRAQIHTLEGVVDVAADEASMFSGQGATPVASGQFVEASGTGVGTPRPFDSGAFVEAITPRTPGTTPGVMFTDPTGKLGPSAVGSPASPAGGAAKDERREVPEDRREPLPPPAPGAPAPRERQDPAQPPQHQKPEDKARRPRIASFQLGGLFTREMGQFGEAPETAVIRAVRASWNPTFPLPFTGFLSVRGHLGFVFARDGSLYNRLWAREYQVFGNAVLFNRFFADVGIGLQEWARSGVSEGLFTVNVGLHFADGGALDRAFVGRSLLLTHPRVEQFQAGIGFAF